MPYNPEKSKLSHQELRDQGYIIDCHCYPNIAYKGSRFSPSEWFEVLTEKEYTSRQELQQIKDRIKIVQEWWESKREYIIDRMQTPLTADCEDILDNITKEL